MRIREYLLTLATLALIAGVSSNAKASDEGFIYGKVTTRGGDTYTGTMRWGTQECFWDDLFNATKDDNPWLRYAKKDSDARDHIKYKILGITIVTSGDLAYTHMFITRFGDIKNIKVRRKGGTTVVMKNGSEYDISGSGDVDVKVQMLDENLGKIKLNWDEIKEIEFMPTPKRTRTAGYRLKGKLISDEMEFKGYIMWDAEECLSTDILDGETDDGDVEIEFGNIRSIKQRGRRACLVTLKDGRQFELRGTNDVNHENRGIYVADDRYGKIEVNWDEFREVIYEDQGDSGNPYDSYQSGKAISGTVRTVYDEEYDGKIVFDFDESEDFEILNGYLDEMEFNIPFRLIASITPKGSYSSIVELVNGEKLRLEDSQDVSQKNDGILVFQDKGKPEFIAWEDVETIVFRH